MPKIIGAGKIVVDHEGLVIHELAGNVATKQDEISIAHVIVARPTSEPWLTLAYDEWLCVLKGHMVLHYENNDGSLATLEVLGGQTAFVAKGERFRPEFPEGACEYIPVCTPAFIPDRCIREEGSEISDVSVNLQKLHGINTNNNDHHNTASQCSVAANSTPVDPDILYHMCQKKLWDDAVNTGEAYFPPTFEEDGYFTHATAVPQRLIETANHFYTSTEGDWICLQLSRSGLKKVGIITKDEEGLPVGEQKVSNDWVTNKWICPHIYGGLPVDPSLNVLTKTFPMVRSDSGQFLSILGLTNQ